MDKMKWIKKEQCLKTVLPVSLLRVSTSVLIFNTKYLNSYLNDVLEIEELSKVAHHADSAGTSTFFFPIVFHRFKLTPSTQIVCKKKNHLIPYILYLNYTEISHYIRFSENDFEVSSHFPFLPINTRPSSRLFSWVSFKALRTHCLLRAGLSAKPAYSKGIA